MDPMEKKKKNCKKILEECAIVQFQSQSVPHFRPPNGGPPAVGKKKKRGWYACTVRR